MMDIALSPFPDNATHGGSPVWPSAYAYLAAAHRRETINWRDAPELWDTSADLGQLAPLHNIHPTELAQTVSTLARRGTGY